MNFDLSSCFSRRDMEYVIRKALRKAKRESHQQSQQHDEKSEAEIGEEAHYSADSGDSVEVDSELDVGREVESLL